MAELTREEVIARVEAGASLKFEGLSELDLSGLDLNESNVAGPTSVRPT